MSEKRTIREILEELVANQYEEIFWVKAHPRYEQALEEVNKAESEIKALTDGEISRLRERLGGLGVADEKKLRKIIGEELKAWWSGSRQVVKEIAGD